MEVSHVASTRGLEQKVTCSRVVWMGQTTDQNIWRLHKKGRQEVSEEEGMAQLLEVPELGRPLTRCEPRMLRGNMACLPGLCER